MNLRIFFDIVKTEVPAHIKNDVSSLYNHIIRYEENFPSLDYADMAIIGLTEEKGAADAEGVSKAADAVREKLYALKKGTGAYRIVDLGNLRCGINIDESYKRIKEVCEVLLNKGIIPVLIGSTHDMDIGQYMGYEGTGKFVSMVNVDASIDMYTHSEDRSRQHVHHLLTHEPNILFNYSHIAYQTYFTDQEILGVLEKLYFEMYRVGQVRKNMEEFEPVIRDADMVSFDISAIRQSDAPGNKNTHPFGLSGEEACQICWYAGLSNKLSSIGFYEYNPLEDIKGQTASVVATMIWYFIEGFYSRHAESPDFNTQKYNKYYVALSSDPHQLVFYKHLNSEKWWMEVPFPESKSNMARNSIVPCSYEDYMTANRGELPNRWILTHAKLI